MANKYIHLLTRTLRGPTKLPVPKTSNIQLDVKISWIASLASSADQTRPPRERTARPARHSPEFRVQGPLTGILRLSTLADQKQAPVAARNKPRRQTSLARFLLSSMAPLVPIGQLWPRCESQKHSLAASHKTRMAMLAFVFNPSCANGLTCYSFATSESSCPV